MNEDYVNFLLQYSTFETFFKNFIYGLGNDPLDEAVMNEILAECSRDSP